MFRFFHRVGGIRAGAAASWLPKVLPRIGKALEEIKQNYLAGAVQLRDFRVERNGNGRDFDIIPTFSGDYAHGYTLRFEIISPGCYRLQRSCSHSSGFYVDGNSNLRIFLTQDEIRKRFPDFTRIACTWSARRSFWTLAMAGWPGCGAMDSSIAYFPRAREANHWKKKYDSELIAKRVQMKISFERQPSPGS